MVDLYPVWAISHSQCCRLSYQQIGRWHTPRHHSPTITANLLIGNHWFLVFLGCCPWRDVSNCSTNVSDSHVNTYICVIIRIDTLWYIDMRCYKRSIICTYIYIYIIMFAVFSPYVLNKPIAVYCPWCDAWSCGKHHSHTVYGTNFFEYIYMYIYVYIYV